MAYVRPPLCTSDLVRFIGYALRPTASRALSSSLVGEVGRGVAPPYPIHCRAHRRSPGRRLFRGRRDPPPRPAPTGGAGARPAIVDSSPALYALGRGRA